MQFLNFPEYFRKNARWAVWRYEKVEGKDKPSKPPFAPVGKLRKISTMEPENGWGTFEEAVACYGDGTWFNGIGLLIEEHLNITIVDLDYSDKALPDVAVAHRRIYETLNSYTEFSPSGQGVHIVSGGIVPSCRESSAYVEVYSNKRFMTVTGNVLNPAAIRNCQFELEQLTQEMIGTRPAVSELNEDTPEKDADAVILQRGYSAVNGEKFAMLWEGRWPDNYPSQSEADQALINMLAHYSPSPPQIRRLFFQSALGQREKLIERPGLLNTMMQKAFIRLVPDVDFSALRKQFDKAIAAKATEMVVPAVNGVAVPTGKPGKGQTAVEAIQPPPGLFGDVMRFFFDAAPYPVPEIALTGAIGFMAGLCGAGWNVNGDGLNLFVLLTAPSTAGKDVLTSGMARIVAAGSKPTFDKNNLGLNNLSTLMAPSVINSGQALTKFFKDKDFFSAVSVQSEFGVLLSNITNDKHSTSASAMLKRMYLNLFGSSGKDKILGSEIWSDNKENLGTRRAISFSLIGESVPKRVYEALTEGEIEDGFVGRFVLIEHNRITMPYNPTAHLVMPNDDLVAKITNVAAIARRNCDMLSPANVNFSPEAYQLLDQYRHNCRLKVDMPDAPAHLYIWGRCHVKALRLAALCAVGNNPNNPVISADDAHWAIAVVDKGTHAILDRFSTGQIGGASDDVNRRTAMVSYLRKYLEGKSAKGSKFYREAWQIARQIPKSLIRNNVCALSAFRSDVMAFERVIKQLQADGMLVPVPPMNSKSPEPFSGELFEITSEVLA